MRPYTIFPDRDGLYAVETPRRYIPGARHPTIDAAQGWIAAHRQTCPNNDAGHGVRVAA